MLIRTSAPQPATSATPTGGTVLCVSKASFGSLLEAREGLLQKRVMRMRRMMLAVPAMFAMGWLVDCFV